LIVAVELDSAGVKGDGSKKWVCLETHPTNTLCNGATVFELLESFSVSLVPLHSLSSLLLIASLEDGLDIAIRGIGPTKNVRSLVELFTGRDRIFTLNESEVFTDFVGVLTTESILSGDRTIDLGETDWAVTILSKSGQLDPQAPRGVFTHVEGASLQVIQVLQPQGFSVLCSVLTGTDKVLVHRFLSSDQVLLLSRCEALKHEGVSSILREAEALLL
jgi:hypothetical protein